jgi:hypothetical protein
MPDGFKTLVTFSDNPAIQLWEKTIKPAGYDAMEKIDTTTMHNTRWRTFYPRQLITMTDMTFKAAFDPDVLTGIHAQIGLPCVITETFPDHSTECFYGFLQKFEIDEMEEGKMPEGQCTVSPTNWDYTNNVEAGPAFAAAPLT